MLRIACPHCGTRDHTEFTYGGDATVKRPPADAPMASWHEAVYLRGNPRGVHEELLAAHRRDAGPGSSCTAIP